MKHMLLDKKWDSESHEKHVAFIVIGALMSIVFIVLLIILEDKFVPLVGLIMIVAMMLLILVPLIVYVKICYPRYFTYDKGIIYVFNSFNRCIKKIVGKYIIDYCEVIICEGVAPGIRNVMIKCMVLYSENFRDKERLLQGRIHFFSNTRNPNILIVQNPESIAFIESIMQGQQPQEENTTA